MQISQPEHTGKHSHALAGCPRRLGGGKQTPTGGAEGWEPIARGSQRTGNFSGHLRFTVWVAETPEEGTSTPIALHTHQRR